MRRISSSLKLSLTKGLPKKDQHNSMDKVQQISQHRLSSLFEILSHHRYLHCHVKLGHVISSMEDSYFTNRKDTSYHIQKTSCS